jgi:ketosteroid isomerase-like protein
MSVRASPVIALLLLGLPVFAADRALDDVAKVKSCEEVFRQAELRYDATTAGKLLADDFMLTGMYGLFTKKQFLSLIGDRSNPLELLDYADMDVRMYGDVAVVISAIHEKARFAGKPYDLRGRRTAVWIRRNGSWTCVTIHVSQQEGSAESSNRAMQRTATCLYAWPYLFHEVTSNSRGR